MARLDTSCSQERVGSTKFRFFLLHSDNLTTALRRRLIFADCNLSAGRLSPEATSICRTRPLCRGAGASTYLQDTTYFRNMSKTLTKQCATLTCLTLTMGSSLQVSGLVSVASHQPTCRYSKRKLSKRSLKTLMLKQKLSTDPKKAFAAGPGYYLSADCSRNLLLPGLADGSPGASSKRRACCNSTARKCQRETPQANVNLQRKESTKIVLHAVSRTSQRIALLNI